MQKNRILWIVLFVLAFVPMMAVAGDSGTFATILGAFTSEALGGGCWFCSIFVTLFNAINNIASSLSETLKDYATRLLYLGFSFYILFKVLKASISFSEINGKEFFMDMLMPILKCLIAMVVLENLGTFYEQIVNPLASLAIGFATVISSDGASSMELSDTIQITASGGVADVEKVCNAVIAPAALKDGIGFDAEVNKAIQCFLKTVSLSLIEYMALGATFIADSLGLGFMHILPLFSMLGVGLCLFIGTFGVFLAFPFKLIDCMFQLMFVAALMPLWVILWVLPPTRDKSAAAFKMFLNVLITFICLSVVMLMVLKILGAALSGLNDPEEFMALLFAGNTKKALEQIDWSTGTFFTMLAMVFLANSLSQNADKFAKEFGGGQSLGIGGALQANTMAGVAAVGSKIGQPVLQKGVGAIKDGIKNSPHALGFVAGRIASGEEATGHKFNPFRKGDFANIASNVVPGAKFVKAQTEQFKEGYRKGTGAPITSNNVEKLAGGKTKETQFKNYMDADGRTTHKETEEVIRNADNVIESKLQKRESFDVKTGVKSGSSEIETKFDAMGKEISKIITTRDAMGRLKSTLQKDLVKGRAVKTEFDDSGREQKIIMTEKSGQVTTQTNSYDSSGVRNMFETEVKDAAGKLIEHTRVDIVANTKKDLITGAISAWR